ncbi:O-antigen ligase OS=Castellaniella defragrans (strain DSM / CCUG 39792 / 65Phen) OX=1437824 GN=BN940_00146 PE=4 SV=1 [Castellaniella denitrificans]|uniref:O-antigen ligase family protein n=1 Tax=Castellaniella sp. TaxID=1955812 RepID=UPI003D131686
MPHQSIPAATQLLTSWGVFIFFAAMFAVLSGYSYGAVLLLLGSLVYFASRPSLAHLDTADWGMAATLLAYFLIPSLMTWWLGNNPTDIDQYSRALLAVPIFLMLCSSPIRLPILWSGIILGLVLSAPLAWWQVNVEGWGRAPGYLNIIHFSNLTLVFTIFCVGGLYWAPTQGPDTGRWRLAFLIGIVCGLYSVILGGSRGSWVALPPVVLIFLAAFLTRRNAARVALITLAGIVVIAGLFAMPGSPLKARYDRGVQDISMYQKADTDTSIGARFEMWRGAWINLQRHPFMGWNQQEYTQTLKDQVQAGELTPVALEFTDNLHNNYLQAWVFTGLPGLLALLALYAVPLWHFGRRLRAADMTERVLAFCGTSVVVSYLCFCLTQAVLRRNNGIMFYLLAVIILWGAMRQARQAAAAAG